MEQNMFVLYSKYTKPVAEVDVHAEGHAAWLVENYKTGKILVSGRRNPAIGGCIIARGESISEIQKWIQGDPFAAHGLAVYEIIEFKAGAFPRRSSEFDLFMQHASGK